MDNISDSLKAKIQICLTRGIDFLPRDKNNQMGDIINIINDILDSPELLKQFEEISDVFWMQAQQKGVLIYYDSPKQTRNRQPECLVGKYQSLDDPRDFKIAKDNQELSLSPYEMIPALALERQYKRIMSKGSI